MCMQMNKGEFQAWWCSGGGGGGGGVNIVLDCVGASYWEKNVDVLATDGTWVLYGLMGGANVEGNLLARLLRKRISLRATTLRARSVEYKRQLVAQFAQEALPRIANGDFELKIDSQYALARAADAHRRVEANESNGKVILLVLEEEGEEKLRELEQKQDMQPKQEL